MLNPHPDRLGLQGSAGCEFTTHAERGGGRLDRTGAVDHPQRCREQGPGPGHGDRGDKVRTSNPAAASTATAEQQYNTQHTHDTLRRFSTRPPTAATCL